ncbi:MAG: type II toxin-antitoxin system PemK/MazF family toxin [Candidatus Hydrogenedentes bacterium]|nr:type II toxin-antitoxin system PemK/MazF family toxin [Candidatus Hydrogenedentota bacterium]
MERGKIRWYRFDPPDKRRPVLVLTRNSAIPYLHSVTVAPITSTIRGVPSEVALGPGDGMTSPCAINLHNLQTVPKREIGARITQLSEAKLQEVFTSISFALGYSDQFD